MDIMKINYSKVWMDLRDDLHMEPCLFQFGCEDSLVVYKTCLGKPICLVVWGSRPKTLRNLLIFSNGLAWRKFDETQMLALMIKRYKKWQARLPLNFHSNPLASVSLKPLKYEICVVWLIFGNPPSLMYTRFKRKQRNFEPNWDRPE